MKFSSPQCRDVALETTETGRNFCALSRNREYINSSLKLRGVFSLSQAMKLDLIMAIISSHFPCESNFEVNFSGPAKRNVSVRSSNNPAKFDALTSPFWFLKLRG